MTATAKLFMHGRSQAVRLPREFRMPGTEVLVRREGDRVILEPTHGTHSRAAVVFAEIDRLGGGEGFLLEVEIPDPPAEPDTNVVLDE